MALKRGLSRWSRPVGIGWLALSLAGCALDGMPVASVPDAPVAFRGVTPRSAAPVPQDWPATFGSRELTTLAQAVRRDNFDIAAAVARVEQADAQAVVDASALYPQLSLSGDVSRTRSVSTTRQRSGPFSSSATTVFSVGPSASYAVDLFGRNRDLANAGQFTAASARFDRATVELTTVATLVNTYLAILSSQDRLRFARENVKGAEDVLAAIRARVDVGTATALDVAQQESVLAGQRATIPGLQQIVDQDRNAIAVLLGRVPEAVTIRGGSLDALRLPNIATSLPSDLLLRRPDIAEAEAALASENADVKAARAAFFPSLNLSASGTFESTLLRNLFRPDALAASIAAGITQPIFNGFSLQGQLDAARGRYRELLENYRKAMVQSFADVENALVAVRGTAEHVRLQTQAVAAARRAYEITQQRLREGTIDVVTLLNAETTLFSAQDTLTQIKLQRAQAAVSLFQALGGGWSRDSLDALTLQVSAAVAPGALVPTSGVPVKKLVALLLLVAIAGAGWWTEREGYWQWPFGGTAREASNTGGGGGRRRGPPPLAAIPVVAVPVQIEDVPITLDGVGTVQALNTVTVRAQVDGRLLELAFKDGQDVRKGDVLARIDPVTFQAQYDQAVAKKAQDDAQLANAKIDLDRYSKLAETNYGSKQQADTQRATVAQLNAQLRVDQGVIDNAKATLDYTTIRAPIDGRTGIRAIDAGNIVHASDASGLVTITQVKPIALIFTVPQQRLSAVNLALARGPVSVDALEADNTTVLDKGGVDVVDNQVDPTTGTVRVKASFPNAALQLWPGQFVNVRLQVDILKGVTVIPTAALQRGPDGPYVFVVRDNNTVGQTPVTVVRQDEHLTVLGQGVEPPERVVTTGFAQLTDNKSVTVSAPTDALPTPTAAGPPRPPRNPPGGARPAGAVENGATRPEGGRRAGGGRRPEGAAPNGAPAGPAAEGSARPVGPTADAAPTAAPPTP